MAEATTTTTASQETSASDVQTESSSETVVSPDSPVNEKFGVPRLPFKVTKRMIYWTSGYAFFLVFLNVAVPCLVYYPIVNDTDLDLQTAVGISSAALGLSSCVDSPFRLYRLVRYRKKYGPLNDDTWWHLDFTMHVWSIAMYSFAFPLAIGPSVPVWSFFLLTTPMLVAPIGIISLIMLKSWTAPFWISSDPRGSKTKPLTYYFLEDIGATDFAYGRDWRKVAKARYEASKPFRDLLQHMSIFLSAWCFIWCVAGALITFLTSFYVAFGLVLGLFFVWLFSGFVIAFFIAKAGLRREQIWIDQQATG